MRELGDRLVTGRAAYFVVGIVFVVVFVGAVLAVWFGSPELKQAGGQTLTASLIGFLTTFLLDVNAKERERVDKLHEAERAEMTQQLEHSFAVGSSSHMANVAFDKHVKFCEDYAQELRSTLATFIEKGPTEQARVHSGRLASMRHEHALWLTPEIEVPLEKFEQVLRDLGVSEYMIAHAGTLDEAERQKRINLIYHQFRSVLGERILGTPDNGIALDEALAIGNLVRWLGRILGVDDLTRLRQKILSNAATSNAPASTGISQRGGPPSTMPS